MVSYVSTATSQPTVDDPTQSRSVLYLYAFLVVGGLPALIGRNALQSAAALFPLAESAHPYFVPSHAGLLYFWTPLVAMSACLLFLTPGLLLSLALDAAKGVGQWVLSALALSLVTISSAAAIVQSLMGTPLRGGVFAAVVVGCSLVCFGFLFIRLTRTRSFTWPVNERHAAVTLLSMVVVPFFILIALTPKFHWENFNGDGAHAFESTRLLLIQSLPFWPPSAGDVASFPGITSMLFTFPGSWFVRLFGEVEASIRLPFLLYLVALYGAVLELVEGCRRIPLGILERGLIWLNLVVYVVVVAFSATYNPYSADIALPATQDTLLMVCFLGFILAFLRQDQKWMCLYLFLTIVSLPSGGLLIGMWLLSVALVWQPRPWKQMVTATGFLLGGLVLAAIAQRMVFGNQVAGEEYGLVGLLRRFAFLQVTDWRRLAFLVVPSGIIPAMALLAWHWQDRIARTITVLTIGYFAFFYIQAHIALHHFIPVMLLPLVVFWRNPALFNPRLRPAILISAAAAGIIALVLSLPQHGRPDITARVVSATIEDKIGGYETLDPKSFRRSEILRYLFPYDWEPTVPAKIYGGSPLTFNYYAHRKNGLSYKINYVVQSMSEPPPSNMRLIAQENDASLYVRSEAVWRSHRALKPPTPAGSSIYAMPRGIFFRSVPLPNGPYIVNVVDVIEGFGFDMQPILDWLGVKR
ncbi:MAG TPA: hypothetical protein VIE89_07860 [Candidatus Binatia bacterium]